MSKHALALVSALALAVSNAGCTVQGNAAMKPMDMAGTAQGPGAGLAVVPSGMAAQLQAAGLDIKNLPPLESVDDDHIEDVMKIIATTLGAKCSDCHVMDKEEDTPNKRVARKMWDEFVVKLSLKDGSPLFCDSCHRGKLEFLDRSDEKALGGWMKTNFVDALARKDGAKHGCATCHGMPFDPEFLDGWEASGEVADGGTESDAGVVISDGGVVPDLGQAVHDLATVPVDMAQTGTCRPVINEVQVAGSAGAGDEFIELYNPCPQTVAVDAFSLVYRSATGTTDSTLLKLTGQTIAAGGYLVVGGSTYGGTAALRYTSGLAGTGGGVALRDGGGALVDSVGYGTASNAFVQGSAAPAPTSGKSIARTPNGSRAHNDNSLDFTVATPTPGAAN